MKAYTLRKQQCTSHSFFQTVKHILFQRTWFVSATTFNWLPVPAFYGARGAGCVPARSLQFSFQSRGSTFHPLKSSLVKHCPLSLALSRSPPQTVFSGPPLSLPPVSSVAFQPLFPSELAVVVFPNPFNSKLELNEHLNHEAQSQFFDRKPCCLVSTW